MDKEIRFSKSARKHKVGKGHALEVIFGYAPLRVQARNDFEREYVWIGKDSRGRELEIVGIELEEFILIIHVMPKLFRRGKSDGKEG